MTKTQIVQFSQSTSEHLLSSRHDSFFLFQLTKMKFSLPLKESNTLETCSLDSSFVTYFEVLCMFVGFLVFGDRAFLFT